WGFYRITRTPSGDAPMSPIRRHLAGLAATLLPALVFAQPADLAEYRTIEQAIAAKDVKDKAVVPTQPGFLGVCAEQRDGKVVVGEPAADSPAAKAGLKRGEVLVAIDGKPLADAHAFREALQARGAGASVKLGVQRDGKPLELTA